MVNQQYQSTEGTHSRGLVVWKNGYSIDINVLQGRRNVWVFQWVFRSDFRYRTTLVKSCRTHIDIMNINEITLLLPFRKRKNTLVAIGKNDPGRRHGNALSEGRRESWLSMATSIKCASMRCHWRRRMIVVIFGIENVAHCQLLKIWLSGKRQVGYSSDRRMWLDHASRDLSTFFCHS